MDLNIGDNVLVAVLAVCGLFGVSFFSSCEKHAEDARAKYRIACIQAGKTLTGSGTGECR